MKAFILLSFLTSLCISSSDLTVETSAGQTLYPLNNTLFLRSFQCGVNYSILIEHQSRVIITQSDPFFASIYTDNPYAHVSGYGQSLPMKDQKKSHQVELFMKSQCTVPERFIQINYFLYVQIEQKDKKNQLHKMRVTTNCSDNWAIKNTKQSIFMLYGALWVVIMSFLPIFPIFHLLPRLIIIFYMIILYFVNLSEIILLLLMIIVFRYSQKPNELPDFSYQQIRQALICQKAYISLFFCFLLFIFINVILLLPLYNAQSFSQFEMSFFNDVIIHIINYIKLWIHVVLFCRVFWLNRIRDLFWWFVIVFIALMMTDSTKYQFFNLLTPSLLCQQCQYLDMKTVILMSPIALYIRRFDKNWQFISSFILLLSFFIPFPMAFWGVFILVLFWVLFSSIRESFLETIRQRWLPIQ